MTPTTTPATDKQKAFIRKLLAERTGIAAAEEVRTGLNALRTSSLGITTFTASKAIDALLAIPATVPTAGMLVPHADRASTIPDGRYALADFEGHAHRFFKVTAGRKAGVVFVDEYASDERYPVKGDRRAAVLHAIEVAGWAAAGKLYADEIGGCARCGRTLTDDTSRAIGYGPDCRAILGL